MRHVSRIHWIVYVPGLVITVIGLAGGAYATGFDERSRLIVLVGAGAVVVVGIASLIAAWFRRWTAELAVTDRRVIYKRGFIRRHSIEMNMDKVESVDVTQSVLGRIFDYGDIVVRGTGAGLEPLKGIDSPIEFRNHVTAR